MWLRTIHNMFANFISIARLSRLNNINSAGIMHKKLATRTALDGQDIVEGALEEQYALTYLGVGGKKRSNIERNFVLIHRKKNI